MDGLTFLDATLILAGNRLNHKFMGCKIGNILNWMIRAAITSSTLLVMIIYRESRRHEPYIQHLQIMLRLPAGLMLMFLFAYRRTRVKRLIRQVIDCGIPKSLTFLTASCFVTAIIFLSFHVMTQLAISLQEASVGSALWQTIQCVPYQMNEYLVLYPAFYITVMKILVDYELKLLHRMKDKILSGTSRPLNLMKELHAMVEMNREFEYLFNIIPFVQFGIIFITIPAAVVEIRHGGNLAMIQSVYFGIENASFFLFISLLVYHACRSKDRVSESVASIIELIHERHLNQLYTHGYHTLNNTLKSYAKLSFTGWYLFNIDRSVVLTFLSSIVTFSVLLIQLES